MSVCSVLKNILKTFCKAPKKCYETVVETSQSTYKANQWTGFYMMANEGLYFARSFQNIF